MSQNIDSNLRKTSIPIFQWQTDTYDISLAPASPLQASITNLETNQTTLIPIKGAISHLTYDELLPHHEKIQKAFFAKVKNVNQTPFCVEFSVRGVGGMRFYSQNVAPIPEIPQGNASLNKFPNTPQELVWVMRQLPANDPRIKTYLSSGAQFVKSFVEAPVHTQEQVDGLVMLVLLEDRDITRAIIGYLIQKIQDDVLLDIVLVNALADAIDRALPTHLNADDLVQLLQTVVERIQNVHSTAKQSRTDQVKAIARIINAMADANVCKIPRQTHLKIDDLLKRFTDTSTPEMKHFAKYAQEAYKRVPDDETKFACFVRHATGVVKGTYHIWMAVKKMDPHHIIQGLFALEGSAKDLIAFGKDLQSRLGSLSDLKEGVMSLKEGLTFIRELPWYEQTRYIELLAESNCFRALELYLLSPKLKKHPSLMYITVAKLHNIILSHGDLTTRKETIAFLQHIYQEESIWSGLKLEEGHFKSEKAALTDILHRDEITQRVSLKGLIIEHLSQYQQISALKAEAQKALTEIETRAKTNKEETNFILRHIRCVADLEKTNQAQAPLFAEENQVAFTLEKKLEKVKVSVTEEPSFVQEQPTYIPPMGTNTQGSNTVFELMQELLNFLKGDQRVLLLLGDSGSGKSFFSQILAAQLWKEYQPLIGSIPFYISLPSLKDPTQNLVTEFCERFGLSSEEVLMMQEKRQFYLILDGLDELPENIDILEQLLNFKGKVVVMCRAEKRPARELFIPTVNGKPKPSLLKEIYVAPFSNSQIDHFIEKCIAKGNTEWKDVSRYRKEIDQIPDLAELITNPFILKIITDILPEIIDRFKQSSNKDKLNLTRFALYQAFTEELFQKGFIRAKTKFNELKAFGLTPQNLVKEALKFCIDLANALQTKGLTQVLYDTTTPEWEAYLGDNPKATFLRSIVPLKVTKDGVYSFIHKSLLEYFIAVGSKNTIGQIAPQAVPMSAQIPPTKFKGVPIFDKILEPSVLQFLADCAKDDSHFCKELLALIEESKKNPRMAIAAANAITVLNLANISFSNKDFRGISIPGAHLEKSNLVGADLRNANLTGVTLNQTVMSGALLAGANMQGVKFAQFPFIKVQNNVAFHGLYCSTDKQIFIGRGHKTLYVIDIKSGKELKRIEISLDKLYCEVVFNEGTRYAYNNDKIIHILDINTGKELTQLIGHTDYVKDLALSNDSQKLFSCSEDKTIRVWDLKKGISINTFSTGSESVSSLTLTKNQDIVAFGNDKKNIILWDIKKSVKVKELIGHQGYINRIRFFNEDKFLIAGDQSGVINVWDLETNQIVKELKGHGSGITSVYIYNNEMTLASGSHDNTVILWDLKTGQMLQRFEGHERGVNGLHPFDNERKLISTSDDRTIRFWEVDSTPALKKNKGHSSDVVEIIPYHYGKKWISAERVGDIYLWEEDSGNNPVLIKRKTYAISDLKVLDNGKRFTFVSGSQGELFDGDLDTGIIVKAYPKQGSYGISTTSTIFENGKRVLRTEKNVVVIYDVDTGHPLRRIQGHVNEVKFIAISKDEKKLAISDMDGIYGLDGKRSSMLALWDLQSGALIKKLDVEQLYGPHVFSESGKFLASVVYGKITIWNVDTGKELKKLDETESIKDIKFYDQDEKIACASKSKLMLFDLKTNSLILSIENHFPISTITVIDIDSFLLGDSVGGLWHWKIKGTEGSGKNLQSELVWASRYSLSCANVNLKGVVGLSEANRQLMLQHGAHD